MRCNVYSYIARLLLCLMLLGATKIAWSLDFELGGGLSGNVLRVKERDDPGAGAQAVMRKRSLSPYVALAGDEYFPFEDYNLGLSWQFWGSSYSINEQKVNEGNGIEYKDIDTKLSGIYFYALPIVYYRWGDKEDETAKGYKVSLGLGYGLSYMTMNGDIRITEAERQPLETIDTQQLYYSAGFFFRTDYKKYFFIVNSFSPQLVHGEYSYVLSTVSWIIGRSFSVDFDFWGLL